jgi:hypothetical protein
MLGILYPAPAYPALTIDLFQNKSRGPKAVVP